MAIIGSCPSDKFKKMLDDFETNGLGYHATIMSTAGILKAMNIPAETALEVMHEASEKVTRRKLQRNEIINAVEYAYNHVCSRKQYVEEPPEINYKMIERVSEAGDIDELMDESKDIPGNTYDILVKLYEEDEILFIAKEVNNGRGQPLFSWREQDLSEFQFICPNPLKKAEEGRVMMNIAERRFIVFESDIPELANEWHKQAGVIKKLSSILDLKLVVWSGNKSLHAWYDCKRQAPDHVHRFENMAMRLGADRSSLRFTQLVRLPLGTREDKIQKVLYYG